MPTYTVTSPDGRTLKIDGTRPPTDAELTDIFAQAAAVPAGFKPDIVPPGFQPDANARQVVIRANDGTEHVFPPGFDPQRAAAIVRTRTGQQGRTLSESEYNAVKQQVLAKAPAGMSESKYQQWIGPAMAQALRDAEQAPQDPNTMMTALRHLASQINPVSMIAATGRAITPEWAARQLATLGGGTPLTDAQASQYGPLNTIRNLGAAQGALYDKAKAAYDQGDILTAARHFVNYLTPIVGPTMDRSSDLFQAGKWAAGGGDALGVGLAMFAPTAISRALQPQPLRTRPAAAEPSPTADALNAAANRRMVDVLAPKVGPNKLRFGRMAADVAPDVLRGTSGLTRSSVADSITENLQQAADALDEAASARSTTPTPTAPLVRALEAKRSALMAQAVPGGQSVIPGPNAPRVAPINQAIAEVRQLGPTATYDALLQIRRAYDQPAMAVYSSAITPDYLKNMADKLGAADVTAAFRDHLARLSPETAAANADYSLWKKAADVVQAADEVDRVRPTVGRSIMARGLGAATGGATAGPLGAAVGAMVAPTVEHLVTSAGPAVKMATARTLAALADALTRGDSGTVNRLLGDLRTAQATTAMQALRSGQSRGLPPVLPAAAQSGATPAETGR